MHGALNDGLRDAQFVCALTKVGTVLKGQKNQNLGERQNAKQNISKETYVGIFLFAPWKEVKKVKTTKAADGFTKMFPKWPRTLMEGMELRLWDWDCFVKSLLSWTLQRFCLSESFVGKLLGVNTNLILLEKWPMSSLFLGMASFALFRRLFVQLRACNVPGTMKLQVIGAASSLLQFDKV